MYRIGKTVINLGEAVNIKRESAPATLANMNKTRKIGARTVGLVTGIASIVPAAHTMDKINDFIGEKIGSGTVVSEFTEVIDGCLEDVEKDVPEHLQAAREDDCYNLLAPEQTD